MKTIDASAGQEAVKEAIGEFGRTGETLSITRDGKVVTQCVRPGPVPDEPELAAAKIVVACAREFTRQCEATGEIDKRLLWNLVGAIAGYDDEVTP